MNPLQVVVGFLGRACLSVIFILSGCAKIFNWQATQQTLMNAICELMTHVQTMEWARSLLQMAVSWVPALLAVATAFELIGGLLILLGLKVRFGALLLLLFLIPTTLVFHSFWFLQSPDRDMQMIMFLKNLSIFGGLLIVLALGKGSRGAPSSTGPSSLEGGD